MRAPVFVKHADGRVTVDHWPDLIAISDEFLEEIDPAFATVGDGIISFHVDPPASYGLVRRVPDHDRWTYAVKSLMGEDDG